MPERRRSNAWRWAGGLAAVAGVLAFIGHAFVAYLTVTGARFDWLVWHRQIRIEPLVAATSMGVATFVITLVLTASVAAIAWSLTTRGKLRAMADAAHTGPPRAWSEFALSRALGLAALGASLAAMGGYLVVKQATGETLNGQDFWVLSVVAGTLVAVAGALVLPRAVALAYSAGEIASANPHGNIIGRLQVLAARQAKTIVLIVAVLTLVAGLGVTKITTDVDVADVLPRGNGNTTAAQNLTASFQSAFTQQVTLQFPRNIEACERDSANVLPNRVTQRHCANVTDEVYVRALEEFFEILGEDEDNPIEFNVGVNAFYKLINWTIAGGQDAPPEAFALPGRSVEQELRYAEVNETIWRALDTTVTPLIDPSFDITASLYITGSDTEASTQQIGQAMLDFRDEYVAMVENGETLFTVWGEDNPPLFTVDLPVANAHSSTLAREDFVTLFPIIFAFIIVTLYISFRNLAAIGIAGAMLLVATVWTYGIMGHMGIALNTLNLTVLPLILGVGIDFAIHEITEFANHKREGMSDEEALRVSGGYAGFAMFIATITSSSGLLVMTVSPSLLMAELGFLSAVAIISVYLLTILFIPALLKLARSSDQMGQRFEPSRAMLGLARSLSRGRIPVAILITLITVGTVLSAATIGIEEFGEPAKNFPKDDPLRAEHEKGIRDFYDIEDGGTEFKTNVIVFEGDNTDLQSHRYIEAVQAEMASKDSLGLSTSRTLPFLMRTWLTVKDGPEGAVLDLTQTGLSAGCIPTREECPLPPVDQADNYPKTRQAIISELDQAFNSPLATFASLFVDHPNYNISIMTFATTTGDFEVAEQGWNDVWDAINAVEDQRPHDLRPAFVGNTALNYLFITEELPWLSYLGVVSAIVVGLLSAIFTKSVRATATVVVVMGLTTVWWLGILPMLDIGLAITLMLPAVFITSIGSDYAIHMAWNLLKNPDREEVYAVVGKAVFYSMLTTVGAFAIFTQTQNVGAAKAMVATVVAILVIFACTVLVTPLFYPVRRDPSEHGEAVAPPVDYIPTTRVTEA